MQVIDISYVGYRCQMYNNYLYIYIIIYIYRYNIALLCWSMMPQIIYAHKIEYIFTISILIISYVWHICSNMQCTQGLVLLRICTVMKTAIGRCVRSLSDSEDFCCEGTIMFYIYAHNKTFFLCMNIGHNTSCVCPVYMNRDTHVAHLVHDLHEWRHTQD